MLIALLGGRSALSQTDTENEQLGQKINAVALTQAELPDGWTILDERIQDPAYFNEFSTITSMFSSLPETGSVNLGHAIQTPEGTFNVEYWAFLNATGATVAEAHLKESTEKSKWLSLRFGDVLMLVCTPDRKVQEVITQRKFVPFLEKLLDESIQAEQQGNVSAAEQGYYALVQAAPVYAKAWLRLGTIYQRANPPKTEAALDAYTKAVQQNAASASLSDEELWQAKVGLGRTTAASGNLDESIKILEEARLIGGKVGAEQEAKTDYFLSVAYAAKRDEDKLIEYLEAALDIQKSEGKTDLLNQATSEPLFDEFKDKKKFKKLLKKYGKG